MSATVMLSMSMLSYFICCIIIDNGVSESKDNLNIIIIQIHQYT